MTRRPAVGVAVIIKNGDQILLMKRQNSHGAGTWATPGGHLEYGESLQACAIREVEEEIGIQITAPTFRTITNDIFEAEGKHYITIWLESTYVSGEVRMNSPREMSAVEWFSWNALPTPCFLPLENLLATGYAPEEAS